MDKLYESFITNNKSFSNNGIFHTVYLVVNLINNKFYIGKHTTKNLNDNYLGSGSILNKAINKYGQDNFKKYYISFHNTEDEAYLEESKLLTKKFIKVYGKGKICYNCTIGGGKSVDDLKKSLNISKSLKGKTFTEERKKKMSDDMLGENNKMYGKKHTKETKEKISNANKGNTFWLGKKHTKETKEKISKAERNYIIDINGTNNPNNKISLDDCIEIYNLLKNSNLSQYKISEMFGVGASLVSCINNGSHWSCKYIENKIK